MDHSLIAILKRFFRKRPISHGLEGINQVGHRAYVGGLWSEMGKLQFDFLLNRGLQPTDYLLDIACGSLRAGVYLIPYLEKGHYLGIEKEPDLIKAGIEQELSRQLFEEKQPKLVVSDSFEFTKFGVQPTYALAQSLFTHLPPSMINDCFQKLRHVINDEGVFYATYFEIELSRENPDEPHDHLSFAYTHEEMERFGEQNGWDATYIGDWGHPRGQIMMEYRPKGISRGNNPEQA